MKHFHLTVTAFILLVIAINGCKLDDPLYTPKLIPIPGYGGGSDTTHTDTTGTGTGGTDVPLGAVGTIIYKVNTGAAVTIKTSSTVFSVIPPNDPTFGVIYPNGVTNIIGADAKNNTTFTLAFEGVKAGAYTIGQVNLNTKTLNLSNAGVGQVKATVLIYKTANSQTTGTLQGTFSGEQIDMTGKSYTVKGSFNFKQ